MRKTVLTEENMNKMMKRVFNGKIVQYPVVCSSSKINIAMNNYFMGYVDGEIFVLEVPALSNDKIKDIVNDTIRMYIK